MKSIKIVVEIQFEDNVNSDKEIKEVTKNVLLGLISQTNNEGLAPEESNTFTESIKVHQNDINFTELHNFI